MKSILINEQDDGYGICSDAQIVAVKTRMEIICDKMGLPYRYDDGAQDFPEDMHDDTELVFELAMDCRSSLPESYVAAVAAANAQCPLPTVSANTQKPSYKNTLKQRLNLRTPPTPPSCPQTTEAGTSSQPSNSPIKPRPITHLEGNLPSNFDEIQDFVFHREVLTDFGEQVWIPRTSIDEADEQTKQSDCFKYIKAAFDQYSEFDCILLNK